MDVLIVAALKSEYDALRQAASAGYADHPGVTRWAEDGHDSPVPYEVGDYLLHGGGRLSVAIARPTRMGAAATAPVASSLVERLRPRCLAMSGVCAGNPAAVALGDVVVAELAYVYDEGKRTPGGLVPDHRQIPLGDAWVRTAQELSTSDLPSHGEITDHESQLWLLARLHAGDNPHHHPARSRYVHDADWNRQIQTLQSDKFVRRRGGALSLTDKGRTYIEDVLYSDVAGPATLPFTVVVGPMASGNVVVKDGLTWEQLAQHGVRSVVGLEMEAATIAHTAHRLQVPEWVVVKGVMDHADPRKDDRYKTFAARASAEVLFKLLILRQTGAEAPSRRPSRVRSVYVIGGTTDETEYPEYEDAELRGACQRLGATIADSGADLVVCSPFPDSADFYTLIGYMDSPHARTVHMHLPRSERIREAETQLRAMLGATRAERIRHWYYPGPESDDAESVRQAWLLCQLMALDHADVVISVGGRTSNTANTILHLAEARRKPIVPYEFLGGASRRAFNRRNWSQAYPGLDVTSLRERDGVGNAMTIADHLLTAQVRGTRTYAWPPERVFISRARADAAYARAANEYLASAGLQVLLGDEKLPSDQTVESAIEDAVLQADLFIVLWSQSYAASRFCYDEIALALGRHRAVDLQIWMINLDGSDVVPPDARGLPQAVAPTPAAVVAVLRDLLDATTGSDSRRQGF